MTGWLQYLSKLEREGVKARMSFNCVKRPSKLLFCCAGDNSDTLTKLGKLCELHTLCSHNTLTIYGPETGEM